MIRGAILIAATTCALTLAALAEEPQEADVKATPLSIHRVITTGFWSHGHDEGQYRVVVAAVGYEHVIYRLFIQWIALDHETQDSKLIRTVPVTEVNNVYGVIHELKPQFNRNGLLKFTVTVEGRGDVKRKRFVTAMPDGRYSIR